ncbi:hypothetical protein [Dactylosporangium sp. CA-092794]|uniref:hypothetical protein n=1 Tax=Dactylosporangium sp. CA-092794 TaxID=3239929 RepID=UPI003D89CAE5
MIVTGPADGVAKRVTIRANRRMAVAHVTNQMREPAADNRGLALIAAAYDGIKGYGS